MTEPIDPAACPSPLPDISVQADGALLVPAPAKINLSLQVDAVRADGFHPLDSLVAKVTFYDLLTLHPDPRCPLLRVLGPTAADAGVDDDNLALRAARAMAGLQPGRLVGGIDLDKRIPAGGGLGGGSSDAAAVIRALVRAWDLGPIDDRLVGLAAELGSDVPLFLGPSACRMTGRGEVITPADVPDFWAVLVLAPVPCPTGRVYRAFDDSPPPGRPGIDAADLTGPPSEWTHRLFNDLAEPAMRVTPELRALRSRLSAAWSVPVHVTGSGSTLFALADAADAARALVSSAPADLRPMLRIVRKNPW